MPKKEFEAFTRLDASDVNTFLMDQSVMSFAGTAARGSAIATPVEGMVTYLEDSDTYESYTNAWLPMISPGVWKTWAPALGGGFTNGNGVWSNARYARIGKTVHFTGEFLSGSTSTYGTGLEVSLPFPSVVSGACNFQGLIRRSANRYPLVFPFISGTNAAFQLINAAGTIAILTAVTATAPHTWTTGDTILISGSYEVE
jgi:hypothetical protein